MGNKNEMMVFNNEMFGDLRVVNIDGEGWLVGKDVVEALGYNKKYSDVIKQHCDEEDYIFVDGKTRHQFGVEFNYKELGQRGGYLVNESGLYALVFESELKEARKFKRWVTSEVLPSVREHGAYLTPDTLEKTIQDPDFLIGLLTTLKEEQIARRNAELKIEEYKPKADYYDKTLCPDKLITTTDIAKDLGMSAKQLNNILVDKKILYKYGKTYYTYAKYNFLVKEKYCDYVISEHSQFLKWTEKGRQWIIKIINENDNKSVDIIVE